MSPLVVIPVVIDHHLIFQRLPNGTANFLEIIDKMCYSRDFKGFGHYSIKIATGATVLYALVFLKKIISTERKIQLVQGITRALLDQGHR